MVGVNFLGNVPNHSVQRDLIDYCRFREGFQIDMAAIISDSFNIFELFARNTK